MLDEKFYELKKEMIKFCKTDNTTHKTTKAILDKKYKHLCRMHELTYAMTIDIETYVARFYKNYEQLSM